jgi:hypothetical protein
MNITLPLYLRIMYFGISMVGKPINPTVIPGFGDH